MTTYVYDGAQAIAETKDGINATLLTGLMIDEVIGRFATAGNRTMLTDALGSVIAEARDDRSIATRREYTPYGQMTPSGEASANDNQYTARESDGTGLYFYRARYYDAQLKGFPSDDPLGVVAGVNRRAYVGGDPVLTTDPTGEFGIVGAVIVGGIDLAIQLAMTDGDISCVNWTDVGLSMVAGALTGGLLNGNFALKTGSTAWKTGARPWLGKHWNLAN